MLKSIEMTGATRDLAIEKALQLLNLDRDDVSVEVLDNGKKGFLGFGSTEAKVKISYEAPDEPVQEPEKKPEVKPVIEKKPVQPAPVNDHVSNDDPRRTTPHLVKSAPEKSEQKRAEEPAEKRAERPQRERIVREPRTQEDDKREPIVPYIDPIPMDADKISVPAAEVVKFIEGLLQTMQIEGKATVLAASEADHIRIDIAGSDMGPVIGRRGDTLDAIQYLASLVLNKFTEDHLRLTIDTENYRAKRAESLERLARKMAVKVCKYHKAMTLEPMNPYERRIIHAALQNFRGVTTHSTGTEPGRRIVISPEGAARTQRRNFQSKNQKSS